MLKRSLSEPILPSTIPLHLYNIFRLERQNTTHKFQSIAGSLNFRFCYIQEFKSARK